MTPELRFHEIVYSDQGVFNGSEWGPGRGRANGPIFAIVPSRDFSMWKWMEYNRIRVTFPDHPGEEHWFDLKQGGCKGGYMPPQFTGDGVTQTYPHTVDNLPGVGRSLARGPYAGRMGQWRSWNDADDDNRL